MVTILEDGLLRDAELGVSTFIAAPLPANTYGSNGLPLTPNSIKILGRFQQLKSISHPHLCQYVDLIRGKHERLFLVYEYYQASVQKCIQQDQVPSDAFILRMAYQTLQALASINRLDIVHRTLMPSNILLDKKGNVKLMNFGFYHMTAYGSLVTFPTGLPPYAPPELIATGPRYATDLGPSGYNVDVWSLGIILLELILKRNLFNGNEDDLIDITKQILNLCKYEDQSALPHLLEKYQDSNFVPLTNHKLMSFLERCLIISYKRRPLPKELLQDDLFSELRLTEPILLDCTKASFPYATKSEKLATYSAESKDSNGYLSDRFLEEVYHFWSLAGGDLLALLKASGFIKSEPPICGMPNLVTSDGYILGTPNKLNLYDTSVQILPLDKVKQKIDGIYAIELYPLVEYVHFSNRSAETEETLKLPVIIKERDVCYQIHRIALFQRLLEGYPHTLKTLYAEATIDIPPLLRGNVWSALLGVRGDVQDIYESIDKETPSPTDRQIEVDIPRCHQYNELLSSPMGHIKFKRILKAWVASHLDLVYWQGLDSLCAPFLNLHFNNEALAFASLSAFISKYLYNFFLKDNSHIIKEYLAVFSQMIAFHDPELMDHLHEIAFVPDLFAIPWFLTAYTHVFPLHKIFHLWDSLLLRNSSFTLCLGLGLLRQLRNELLQSGFNECILLFSDLPEMDIDICVKEARRISSMTPPSICRRQYENRNKERNLHAINPFDVIFDDSIDNDELKVIPDEDPPSTQQRLEEMCPRLSTKDLVRIYQLDPTGKMLAYGEPAHHAVTIIDIRDPDEFNEGHIPYSINVPASRVLTDDSLNMSSMHLATLSKSTGKFIVVVGNSSAPMFAHQLVKQKLFHVSVLSSNGLTILRHLGLLTLPLDNI